MTAATIPIASVEVALAATTAMALLRTPTVSWTIMLPSWLPWAVLTAMGLASCWVAISHPGWVLEAGAYEPF